jgi:hypothetical protein
MAIEGAAGTDRNTVLVWGAVHMPGIGAGLHRHGFRRLDGIEWRTAATELSIRSALRQRISSR